MQYTTPELHPECDIPAEPCKMQRFSCQRRWCCLLLLSALLLNTGTIHAVPLDVAFKILSDGNAVALVRNALTFGNTAPPSFSLDDCYTQRNLSVAGRVQAEVIGELFRSQGIADAQVFSSDQCRSSDTAALLELGDVKTLAALNPFAGNRSAAESQTSALSNELKNWLLAPTTPVVLVTQQANIQALTQTLTYPGEILIVTMAEDAVVVLASIPTEY